MSKKYNPFKQDIGYTQFDNIVLDYVMPELPASAWKILCFIIRQTKGYQRDSDQLSYRDIMAGSGIKSSATVSKNLTILNKCGFIITTELEGQYEANSYHLNTSLEIEATSEIEAGSALKNKVQSALKNEEYIKEKDLKERKKEKPTPPVASRKDDSTSRTQAQSNGSSLKNMLAQVESLGVAKRTFIAMVDTLLDKQGLLEIVDNGGGDEYLAEAQSVAYQLVLADQNLFRTVEGLEALLHDWDINDFRGQKGDPPVKDQLVKHAGKYKKQQEAPPRPNQQAQQPTHNGNFGPQRASNVPLLN